MKHLSFFIDLVRDLYRSREIIRAMAMKEVQKRYAESILGLLWAVINPLSQIAIYGIIFGIFFKSRPASGYGTDSFFLYLVCGFVPWQFFVQSISQSTNVIVANSSLIKKAAGFPPEILPIIIVGSNIIEQIVSIGLLVAILLVFTGKLTFLAPLVFVYLFFMSFFAVGVGWIFSSINVYLRDVQQIVGVMMRGWFFFTPVFYSPHIIPKSVLPILRLNPMYHVVDGYRCALLAGRLPSLSSFVYLVGISLLTFFMGQFFFKKLRPEFAEVL